MNNEKVKNVKQGGEKLRIRKLKSAKMCMKLVWKIHAVDFHKGALL